MFFFLFIIFYLTYNRSKTNFQTKHIKVPESRLQNMVILLFIQRINYYYKYQQFLSIC